jgi:hypothetical protein
MTRGKAVEKVWPYIVAIIALIVYLFYWQPTHPLQPNLRDVLTPMVSFGASLAGFMLAAASILITVRDRESSWYVKRAKEAGVYASLIRYLLVAMTWCLTTSVMSVAGLAYDPRWNLWWYPYATTLWLFTATVALGTTVRVIRIFTLLIRLVASE